MRIAGAGESGRAAEPPREVVRAAAPAQRAAATVRLVARIASPSDRFERTAALDELPPGNSSPAQTAAATRAWLNATLDPLDAYVDGYPALRGASSGSSTLGPDGILA